MENLDETIYYIPMQAEFQGEVFDISLEFNRWDNALWGFGYTKITKGKDPQAVQSATSVARHYGRYIGEGYYPRLEVPFKDLTTEDVERIFSNPRYSTLGITDLENGWVLYDEVDRELQEALDVREQSETWKEGYGKDGLKLGYVLRYTAYYNPETDKTVLDMRYGLHVVTADTFLAARADPPAWWEKLIEWTK